MIVKKYGEIYREGLEAKVKALNLTDNVKFINKYLDITTLLEYLQMTDKLRARFQKEKRMMSQRKDYHIYSCPGCGQKIRIPRGGFKKVEIECPKCHTKFIKRR